MKRPLLLALLLSTVCAGASWSQWSHKAYDATYANTGPQGNSTMRMTTDGKGHSRTEISPQGAGGRTVMIYDFPGNVMYMLIEAQKMYMRMPLNVEQTKAICDPESAGKQQRTPLGVKVIDGHPCHGWRYTSGGISSDVWFADDLGVTIHSESHQSGFGKSTMHLKSYSNATPSSSLFTLPPGYQQMAMPVGGGK